MCSIDIILVFLFDILDIHSLYLLLHYFLLILVSVNLFYFLLLYVVGGGRTSPHYSLMCSFFQFVQVTYWILLYQPSHSREDEVLMHFIQSIYPIVGASCWNSDYLGTTYIHNVLCKKKERPSRASEILEIH